MENGPFTDDFPNQTSIYNGFFHSYVSLPEGNLYLVSSDFIFASSESSDLRKTSQTWVEKNTKQGGFSSRPLWKTTIFHS